MSAMDPANATETVTVELPCGFLKDDKLNTEAEIIPMTGKIRKMIARPETRQNPAKVIDTLLTQCVVSIGGMTRVSRAVTDHMFLGDRDFLVMEIRKISLGKDVHSDLNCDSCSARMSVTIDLDRDVPIKKLKDMKIELVGDTAVFELVDEMLGIQAKFKLPTGYEQHMIAPMYRKNPIAANYALYQTCLMSWGERGREEIDPNFFDDLSLKVLDFIDENFMESMPGPDMRVPIDCVECGNEMVMSLESSDFLFRIPKKTKT